MGFITDSIDLVLPRYCVICKRKTGVGEGTIFPEMKEIPVCKSCLSKVIPLTADRRWSPCLVEPYPGNKHPELKLYMPFNYDEFFSGAVKALKFAQNKEIGVFLGIILARLLQGEKIDLDQFDMVIPVPLSRARLLQRGYNQAELIAAPISNLTKVPLVPDVLLRTRDTLRQSEIVSSNERANNINGAFMLNPSWDVAGQNILLIDDVATTGFTLNEAASALLDNRANTVLCVAVCGNRCAKNAEMY